MPEPRSCRAVRRTPQAKRSCVKATPARRCSSSFEARRGVGVACGTHGEVARLRNGDVFGEMSLLTGEARSATVAAAMDSDLLEIDTEGFRSVVIANPSVLEHVTNVTASRREELHRHREAHTLTASTTELRQSLLTRVRQFLRL